MKSSPRHSRRILLALALVFGLIPWSDRPGVLRLASIRAMDGTAVATPNNVVTAAPVELEDPSCLIKDPPPPVLKVKVRVPQQSTFEQTLIYKICIENCSTSEAHNVIVKHSLPASVRLIKADPEPAKGEPEMQWGLGTIGASATREIILHLQPTMKEDIKNCTRVQFEHGVCLTTRIAASAPGTEPGGAGPRVMPIPKDGEFPPGAGKDFIPAPPIPVPQGKGRPPLIEGSARLQLQVAGPTARFLNQTARYFVTVKNTGNKTATKIVVSAVLEGGDFVSSNPQGIPILNTIAWSLDSLDAGAEKMFELVFKAKNKGRACVKFRAVADQDAVAINEHCTEFLDASTLHMEIKDTKDAIGLGERTSYPILVKNQGFVPLTNLRLRVFTTNHLNVRTAAGPVDGEQKDGPPTPGGKWLEFPIVPRLESLKEMRYRIDADAIAAGEARVLVEIRADELEVGPVSEQESTTIFADKR